MTFNYLKLRFIVGIIAIILAPLTVMFSSTVLPSISYSYYTESRDIFVGLLFFISAFLFAYNGHSKTESILSKLAGLCSIGVAVFPTSIQSCSANFYHLGSAVGLFLILTYFVYIPFRSKIKDETGKKKLRSDVYLGSAILMALGMIGTVIAIFTLDCQTIWSLRLVFWGELIALLGFGIAWIVSGKTFSFFTDPEEKQDLFK